jgi:hypothetical protein
MKKLLRTTGGSFLVSDASPGVSGAGIFFMATGAPGAGFRLVSNSVPFRGDNSNRTCHRFSVERSRLA